MPLVPSPVVRIGSIAAVAATFLLAAAPAAPQQGALPPLEDSAIGSLSRPAPTHAPLSPDGDALPNPDRVGIVLVTTTADQVIGVWVTGRRGDAAVPSACMALLQNIRGRIVPDRLPKLCAGLPIRRLLRAPTAAAAIQAAEAPGRTPEPVPVPVPTPVPTLLAPSGIVVPAINDQSLLATTKTADTKTVATAVPSTTPAPRAPRDQALERQALPRQRSRLADGLLIVAVDDRGRYTGAWQAGAARRARISDTCIRMLRRNRGHFLSAAVGRQCGLMLYVARIDDPDPESNPLAALPQRPPSGGAMASARRPLPSAVPPRSVPPRSVPPRSVPSPSTARPAPPPRKPTMVAVAGPVAMASPPETAAPPAEVPEAAADLRPVIARTTAPERPRGPVALPDPADPTADPTDGADDGADDSNLAADGPPSAAVRVVSVPTETAGPIISVRTHGDSDFPRFKDREKRSSVPPTPAIPIHFDIDLTLIEAPLAAVAVPPAIARHAGVAGMTDAARTAPKAFDPGPAARAAIRTTPPDSRPAPSDAQAGVAIPPTRLELFVDAAGRFTGRWRRRSEDAAFIVTPACRAALAARVGQTVDSGPIDPCGRVQTTTADPKPSSDGIPPALP